MSRPSRKRFKKTHGPDFLENYDSSFEEPIAKCDYCLLTATCNRKGEKEELLVCKDCNAKAHPSCMDYTGDLAARSRRSPWQCFNCKTCYVCQEPEDADSMLFCDSCDKGYHMCCHRPQLTEKPIGKWVCHKCQKEEGQLDAKEEAQANNGEDVTDAAQLELPVDGDTGDDLNKAKLTSTDGESSEGTVEGTTTLPTPSDSPIPDEEQIKEPFHAFAGKSSFNLEENKENLTDGDVPEWSIDEVEKFLNSIGFLEQSKAFKEQEIDGRSLLLMKREDVLTGLSLKLGPALKIYKHVKRLQVKHAEDFNNSQ